MSWGVFRTRQRDEFQYLTVLHFVARHFNGDITKSPITTLDLDGAARSIVESNRNFELLSQVFQFSEKVSLSF